MYNLHIPASRRHSSTVAAEEDETASELGGFDYNRINSNIKASRGNDGSCTVVQRKSGEKRVKVLQLVALAAGATIAAALTALFVLVLLRVWGETEPSTSLYAFPSHAAPVSVDASNFAEERVASLHGRRLSYLQDSLPGSSSSSSGGSVFMSDYCLAMTEDDQLLSAPVSFSVVITARDEPKEVLLKTVRSGRECRLPCAVS